MKLATASILLFLLLTGDAPATEPVVLRDTGPDYPYEAESFLNGVRWNAWRNSTLDRDIDGDGLDEEFETNNSGVYCYQRMRDGSRRSLWWHNLDRKWANQTPCASLEGIYEVARDGDPELVLVAATLDGQEWRIERRRVEDGTVVAAYDLRGGADRDGGGTWDGFYKVLGVVDVPQGADARRALIVGADAGLDLQPRGVLALDTETGETLWEYFVGPRFTIGLAEIVDLEGDGEPEILFSGRAVNNIRETEYNGTRDDRSIVFVLRADGRLAWSYTSFWGTGVAYFATVDRDRDGRREVIVAGGNSNTSENRLVALDWRGAPTDSLRIGSAAVDLAAASRAPGAVDIYVAQADRTLGRITYTSAGFRRARAVRSDRNLIIGGVFELLPSPGLEVVAGDTRNLWVFSPELDPLCLEYAEDAHMMIGNLHARHVGKPWPELVVSGFEGRRGVDVAFRSAPKSFPMIQVLLGIAALLAGTLIWQRLRRPRLPVRELRLQFLRSLDAADHGRLGSLAALKGLQADHRLWRAGEGDMASTSEEYHTRVEECLERSIPNLVRSLETAALVRLDRLRIQQGRRALGRMRQLLESAGDDETADRLADRIGNEFDDHCDELGGAMERLFAEAQRSFAADPLSVAARVIEEHRSVLRAADIEVQVSESEAPACCIDEEHLTQVLDNLVENAVRAMCDRPERRLTIDWSVERDTCVLRVGDTGCGIDPAQWSTIMEPGVSSRDGGGRGLAAGRSLMRMYGGGLFVRRSVPGEGTTMEVRCPVNREATGQLEANDG